MDDPTLTQISRYIERARQDLLSQSHDDDAGALLFMGEMQDPIPRTLIIDPILNAVDIRIWMLLRVSIANPSLPGKLPSQNELSNLIHCSKMTIWSGMQVLRLNRWLSLCDRVKDDMGKNRGNVYVIHTEPMAIADTLELDPLYIDFIEQSLESRVARIKNNAMSAYISLHKQISSEHSHTFNRTQLQQHEARFSALHNTDKKSILSEEEQQYYAANFSQLEGSPDYEEDFQEKQAVNKSDDALLSDVNENNSTDHKNCTRLKKPIIKIVPSGKNTGYKNCTSLKNTEHKNCTRIEMAQPSHSSPGIKIVPGKHSNGSSNISLNITTTTTMQEKKLKSFDRFKKMCTPNEFPIVKRLLLSMPENIQQDVLDQVLGRLVNYQKTGRNEIENLIGFMSALKRAVAKGEFMVDSHGLMIKSAREAEEQHEQAVKNPPVNINPSVAAKADPINQKNRQKGLDALSELKNKMKF